MIWWVFAALLVMVGAVVAACPSYFFQGHNSRLAKIAGLGMIGLGALLGFTGNHGDQMFWSTEPTAATMRWFDADARREFLELLEKRFPNHGTVEVKYVDDSSLKRFADQLTGLFDTAKWPTTPQNPLPQTFEGFVLLGENEQILGELRDIFKKAGVMEARTELRREKTAITDPDWDRLQRDFDVLIGYPPEQ